MSFRNTKKKNDKLLIKCTKLKIHCVFFLLVFLFVIYIFKDLYLYNKIESRIGSFSQMYAVPTHNCEFQTKIKVIERKTIHTTGMGLLNVVKFNEINTNSFATRYFGSILFRNWQIIKINVTFLFVKYVPTEKLRTVLAYQINQALVL